MPRRHFNRFDEINEMESNLTPRQWAIMLADEMRRCPSELEFLRAMAELDYRQWPFKRPYFALMEKAKKSDPDESSAKLRREFHALHSLINIANRETRTRSESCGVRVGGLRDRLAHVLLVEAVAEITNSTIDRINESHRAGAGEGERPLAMGELGQLNLAAVSPRPPLLQATDWADEATMLLMELYTCKVAVERLQDTYFNGHEILWRDMERRLQSTIQAVLEMIANFDTFVEAKLRTFAGNQVAERWTSLRINAEAIRDRASEFARIAMVPNWERSAICAASVQVLQETGKHEEFIERQFRKHYGSKVDGKASAG